MIAGSLRPFFEGNIEGFEENFPEGVDGGYVEEVLMQIDAEEPNDA
jgi:hypothetical protein